MLPSARKSSTHHDSGPRTGEGAKPMESFEDVGAELARDAKIWKMYVAETDRSDKEMIDGWNDSLDVLLLFAGLFSAITTALVVESSKQLQEDPTKVSAQTLLLISQNLIALSNNHPTSAPGPLPMDSSFSPSSSIILVNTLWFFSLSLSVVVSLIAMLSKSWCYSFMSGRSGSKYEQARRRQQRWDGIKTWKMKNVITYLPALMHLALLLFIIGLCVYLWSINIRVALPVLAITAAFVGFYVGITALPWFFKFCPYSTPASNVFAEVARSSLFVLIPIVYVTVAFLEFILHLIMCCFNTWEDFELLSSFLDWLAGQYPTEPWFKSSGGMCSTPASPWRIPACWTQDASSLEEFSVDRVTCRMLDLLITSSEDTACVDLALQAIAGARFSGNNLLKKAPINRILGRLKHCFWMNSRGNDLRLKHTSSISTMLQFCRALSCLATSYKDGLCNKKIQRSTIGELGMVLKFGARLFIDQEFPSHDSSLSVDHAALAASAFIPFSHWAERFSPDVQTHLESALQQFIRLIQLHIDGTAVLHPGALLTLVGVSPDWVIEYFPGLSSEEKSRSLSLLVQLLYSPDCATPQFEYSIGLALTMAAVVTSFPSNQERPRRHLYSTRPSNRPALDIYSNLKALGLNENPTLVAFGLLGLLDKANIYSFSNSTVESIAGALAQIKISQTQFQSINTIRPGFTIDSYATQIFAQYLQPCCMQDELYEAAAIVCILHPWPGIHFGAHEGQLEALAVKAFSNTQFDNLKSACVKHLDYRGPLCSGMIATTFTNPDDFVKLFQISLDDNSPFAPTAMCRLWSVVSSVLKVKSANELSVLEQMLKHEAFTLCQTSASTDVSSPRDMHQMGFVNIWYPLLLKMKDDNNMVDAVNKSKILTTMARFYAAPDMCYTVSPDGPTWAEQLSALGQVYNLKAHK